MYGLRFENFCARSNCLEHDDYRGETVGPAFRLAIACSGLQVVRLHIDNLAFGYKEWTCYDPRSLVSLVWRYQLDMLPNCKILRKVIWDVGYTPGNVHEARVALAKWTKDEFAKTHRDIECEITRILKHRRVVWPRTRRARN